MIRPGILTKDVADALNSAIARLDELDSLLGAVPPTIYDSFSAVLGVNSGAAYAFTEIIGAAAGGYTIKDGGRVGTVSNSPAFEATGFSDAAAGTVVQLIPWFYDVTLGQTYAFINNASGSGGSCGTRLYDSEWLTASTDLLQIVLGEAATTQLPWTLDYLISDGTSSIHQPQSTKGVTNSTTAVTMLTGQTAKVMGVSHASIFNADSIKHVVTIRLNLNGTIRQIVSVTLQSGESLMFDPETADWHFGVGDNTGQQGPAGTQGIQGQPGSVIYFDADEGEAGPMIPGNPGMQGSQGIQGIMGQILPGMEGEPGEDSVRMPGNPGPQGAQGIQGVMGQMMLPFDADEGEMGMPIPGGTGFTSAGTAIGQIPVWNGSGYVGTSVRALNITLPDEMFAQHIFYVANQWNCIPGQQLNTTVSLTAGDLWLVPIISLWGQYLIASGVQISSSVNAKFRMGLYLSNPPPSARPNLPRDTPIPTDLVQDFGEITVTAGDNKWEGFGFGLGYGGTGIIPLAPGRLYWLAYTQNVTGPIAVGIDALTSFPLLGYTTGFDMSGFPNVASGYPRVCFRCDGFGGYQPLISHILGTVAYNYIDSSFGLIPAMLIQVGQANE